ncbi:hypothetical protein CPB86DRAFT_815817 [Serendipita vermifera]|nr:hypothetical protein CPB86DRAFT_815817 [Serendipita vermifera]
MSVDTLKRRVEWNESDQRPVKKARLDVNTAFPSEFSDDKTEYLLAMADFSKDEFPDIINGGRIKGTVAHVNIYASRNTIGLILTLHFSGDDAGPLRLECELSHARAMEYLKNNCRMVNKSIHLALSSAKCIPRSRRGELPFKLVFEDIYLYLEPYSNEEPKFLEFHQGEAELLPNTPSETVTAAAPSSLRRQEELTKSTEVANDPAVLSSLPSGGLPLESEQKETHPEHRSARARKRDTRKQKKNKNNSVDHRPTVIERPEGLGDEAALSSFIPSKGTKDAAMSVQVVQGQDVAPEDEKTGWSLKADSQFERNSSNNRDDLNDSCGDNASEVIGDMRVEQDNQESPPKPTNHVFNFGEQDSAPKNYTFNFGDQVEKDTDGYQYFSSFTTDQGRFIPLIDIHGTSKSTEVNVIGVVVDYGDLKSGVGRTGQFSRMISLRDDSIPTDVIKVNVFSEQMEGIPNLAVGQIILLHRVKVDEWSGKRLVGYSDKFKWIGWDPETQTKIVPVTSPQLGHDHLFNLESSPDVYLEHFLSLAEWYNALERPEYESRTRRHMVLSELSRRIYFNATVEILKIERHSNTYDIYVTDYTKNDLFDNKLSGKLASFPKKAVLKIVIWHDNASSEEANMLKEGKIYYIENMQFCDERGWIGRMRQHWSSFRMLPEKSEIQNIEQKALLDRRSSFEFDNVLDDASDMLEREQSESVSLPKMRLVCGYNAPTKTVGEVEMSTFCPNKFRIRVRVLDILPELREDIFWCQTCNTRLHKGSSGLYICLKCKFFKHFNIYIKLCLLVVDADHSTMVVRVSGRNANRLFGISTENITLQPKGINLAPLIRDVEEKLLAIVGNLWSVNAIHRATEISSYRVEAAASQVDSPWVDMAVESWEYFDQSESQLVRNYSLFDCDFEQRSETL